MGQELTSDARPSDGSQPEDYLGKSILGRGVVTEGFDGGALGLNEIKTRVEDASTLGFPLCKATALSCPFIHDGLLPVYLILCYSPCQSLCHSSLNSSNAPTSYLGSL